MKYLHQFVTTSLNVGGGIDASQTTGIVLQSLNNVDATKPSVACISWADPLSTSVAEWVTYTSINSTTNTLQGVTRGAEGYSAKVHSNGATVAFPLSKAHVNELNDAYLTAHDSAGVHKAGATYPTPVLSGTVTGTYTLAGTPTFTSPTINSPIIYSPSLYTPLFYGNVDGWISANTTWAYATANTITVPSGAAAIYRKGDKIKLTQTTAKYFYVVGVADTVLTVTGGTDYTVANEVITLPFYSHQSSPLGFPDWFACAAPTWDLSSIDDGSGGQPTADKTHFRIVGNSVNLRVSIKSSSAKVGDGASLFFTIPATLPNLVAQGTLQTLGAAVVTNNNLAAVALYKAATQIWIISPSSIANDTNMIYTSCDATYQY